MKTGPVAVHEDHGGGKVESTCGQDSIRRLAVERLAGHQSGCVVVVAWEARNLGEEWGGRGERVTDGRTD